MQYCSTSALMSFSKQTVSLTYILLCSKTTNKILTKKSGVWHGTILVHLRASFGTYLLLMLHIMVCIWYVLYYVDVFAVVSQWLQSNPLTWQSIQRGACVVLHRRMRYCFLYNSDARSLSLTHSPCACACVVLAGTAVQAYDIYRIASLAGCIVCDFNRYRLMFEYSSRHGGGWLLIYVITSHGFSSRAVNS